MAISAQPSDVTKAEETALAIGLQIEQLARVLDDQDYDALDAAAFRLKSTAQKYGADRIGQKAEELGVILGLDRNPHSIIQVANELLDLCRATQASFLEASKDENHRDATALWDLHQVPNALATPGTCDSR